MKIDDDKFPPKKKKKPITKKKWISGRNNIQCHLWYMIWGRCGAEIIFHGTKAIKVTSLNRKKEFHSILGIKYLLIEQHTKYVPHVSKDVTYTYIFLYTKNNNDKSTFNWIS